MEIRAIEKSTGIGIATGSCIEEVLQQASIRKVAPDNVAFVVGEKDILLYQLARDWVGRYQWLTQQFLKSSAQEYFVKAAKSRLMLWRTIAESRIVENECRAAADLSHVIGDSLSDDVENLLRMGKTSDCRVFGLDINESWAAARPEAVRLSRRHTSRSYVLAVHKELGAIVVAPDYKIAENPGFKIKYFFQDGRTL